MNEKQLIAIMEKATQEALNEERLGGLISKKLAPYLKAADPKRVIIGSGEPGDLEIPNKATFSQLLGDFRRVSKGLALKFIPKESLISVETKAAMYEGDDASGGYLVPIQQSREIINLLNNYSVVRALCREVPMSARQITFPTVTGGLTAYWVPETEDVKDTTDPTTFDQSTGFKPASKLTLGQLTITAYVCAVKVVVSNQLLDDSDPGVDTILRSIFAETIGDAFDTACLRGAGTALDPITGLDGKISTNALSAGADFNYDDIVDLIFGVRQNAPKAREIPIVGHPKAEKTMLKIKDDQGQYIYKTPRESGDTPRIWGEPFHRDGNVLTNLGGGSNTRLYAGDFANAAFVGARMGVVIKANPWTDPGFSHNQTTFLAEARLGFNVSSESRFAYMDGVPTT